MFVEVGNSINQVIGMRKYERKLTINPHIVFDVVYTENIEPDYMILEFNNEFELEQAWQHLKQFLNDPGIYDKRALECKCEYAINKAGTVSPMEGRV